MLQDGSPANREELQLQKSQVSMIEIGVHTGSTAKFLLDRAPFLQWTGIDPYIDYRTGSGALLQLEVAMFHRKNQENPT